jgi:hypothetical protein
MTPSRQIEVAVKGNKLGKEIPKGFVIEGGFSIHIVPSQLRAKDGQHN